MDRSSNQSVELERNFIIMFSISKIKFSHNYILSTGWYVRSLFFLALHSLTAMKVSRVFRLWYAVLFLYVLTKCTCLILWSSCNWSASIYFCATVFHSSCRSLLIFHLRNLFTSSYSQIPKHIYILNKTICYALSWLFFHIVNNPKKESWYFIWKWRCR